MIFICQDIICRIPVAEAIHINLIHHGTLRPVRRIKARNQDEIVVLIRPFYHTTKIVIAGDRTCLNFKIPADLFIIQLQLYFIIIKLRV